jgi:hypothetical protein
MSHQQGNTNTAAFLAFHAANPQVYRALLQLAREWKSEGKSRGSIALFYNVVRWRMSLAGDDLLELNDHHQAYYARALMICNPELSGMFALRSSDADDWAATLERKATTA